MPQLKIDSTDDELYNLLDSTKPEGVSIKIEADVQKTIFEPMIVKSIIVEFENIGIGLLIAWLYDILKKHFKSDKIIINGKEMEITEINITKITEETIKIEVKDK